MESIKKILFLCDGNVPECKKTHCYKSGGECKCTSDIRHAINFENVSEYGTYYKIGHDIKEPRCKKFVDGGKSIPKLFMTAKQLSEYEGMTVGHYYHIFGEMAEEVKTGRYPDVVLGGSPVSVNYYAYRDYITNRKALRDRNARKRVKPFDPVEVARLCPIVREVIVMGDEDD